jgi:hypothetical protein
MSLLTAMHAENSGLALDFWKKIGALILILCLVDVFLAVHMCVHYGDLLFVEGVVVFAAGAYVAAGVANLRRESYATLTGSPEGYREYLEEQRSRQVSDGILLMVIGAIINSSINRLFLGMIAGVQCGFGCSYAN